MNYNQSYGLPRDHCSLIDTGSATGRPQLPHASHVAWDSVPSRLRTDCKCGPGRPLAKPGLSDATPLASFVPSAHTAARRNVGVDIETSNDYQMMKDASARRPRGRKLPSQTGTSVSHLHLSSPRAIHVESNRCVIQRGSAARSAGSDQSHIRLGDSLLAAADAIGGERGVPAVPGRRYDRR